MKYCSTRNSSLSLTASQAILKGISDDGGLFVPSEIPDVNLNNLMTLTYPELAAEIIGSFLTDYSKEFLLSATNKAYGNNFENPGRTVKIDNNLYSLELWNGPTCAFKDYALQLMPLLLEEAKKINNDTDKTLILVATSGDTGKAALEGYKNMKGIEIIVFYPNDGTSETQRIQMATQDGDNVMVYAINGNFDDAQAGVKSIFANQEFLIQCSESNTRITSANSINWGRLVPQIVYYFASYINLVKMGEVTTGEKVSFAVPTGNFGDILAGYYAKQMGLPIDKLICASNQNNVLADFGKTSSYDINRKFHKTHSPSMDILVSSNFERLLYHITNDEKLVTEYMNKLAGADKKYTVDKNVKQKIDKTFHFDWADEAECISEIAETYAENKYLADPHTAVAISAAKNFLSENAKCVVLSTASPYKFSVSGLMALNVKQSDSDFENIVKLQEKTGITPPKTLTDIFEKPIRFTDTINVENILDVVKNHVRGL